LAAEAGVLMPKPEHRNEGANSRRTSALGSMRPRDFGALFRGATALAAGQARAYLERRGLGRDTTIKFRLGRPNSRPGGPSGQGRLHDTRDDRPGMLIGGDDIPQPYDRFRNRVMFPITDLKDRVIAFGGRALENDVPAKYLNSPETPLFHKGSILFNAARARPLAYEREQIIAVEGYMDVVALTEAGFGQSVAPLGTADRDQPAAVAHVPSRSFASMATAPARRRASVRSTLCCRT
jgi:DNA primase